MPDLHKSLRLPDLQAYCAVLRERNLTRAAEALDTTQPAISKALARLRAQFEDPLFSRSGLEMHPTPKALQMAEAVRDLLASANVLRVFEPSFDPSASRRVFRLLLSDAGMLRFLPPLAARLAKEGPRLGLHALPFASRSFEQQLELGEADLALVALRKAPPGLRRQRLQMGGYLSVVRRDHPEAGQLHTRSGFRSARHIIVMGTDTGHSAHRSVQQALEAEIADENVLLRLPSFTAAAIVASRTNGVATVPVNLATLLAESLALATFKPPIPLPPIEIAQYWHERYHYDPGHRWFRSLCFSLFAKAR